MPGAEVGMAVGDGVDVGGGLRDCDANSLRDNGEVCEKDGKGVKVEVDNHCDE